MRTYKAILQYIACLVHSMDYYFADKEYRPYRRGENRCKKCGLKT